MTDFETIRSAVTAREAAEAYGLRFERRSNRAFCPWHDDGRHPALAFYGDRCYCHVCHRGGDAVELAKQIFGLSAAEAARRVAADFRIELKPESPAARRARRRRIRRRADAGQALRRRWNALCDIKWIADRVLKTYTLEDADNPRLWRFAKIRALCEDELENMTPALYPENEMEGANWP